MTASVYLRDVSVEFPIYSGGSRSLKKLLFNSTTQGNLARDASDRFDPDVVDRVTPGASVAAKRTPQSTAPAAVDARLAEVRRWLDDLGKLC